MDDRPARGGDKLVDARLVVALGCGLRGARPIDKRGHDARYGLRVA